MAKHKSELHKQMDKARDAMMVEAAKALMDGLPPLGLLTATMAVVEEQIAAILRGAAMRDRLLPISESESALEQYLSVVRELLATTAGEHLTVLYKVAQDIAKGTAPGVADREVAILNAMLNCPDKTDRPS